MMALNLEELKVSKNTKAHIWKRHRINKKRVLCELTHGILDAIQEDNERIAVFTKNYFVFIIGNVHFFTYLNVWYILSLIDCFVNIKKKKPIARKLWQKKSA